MRSAVRAVPPWVWLGAIVIASFALRAWLARGMLAPFIMVDELIYGDLARSLADTGHFAVRDVPASGYSVLYPALVAPAYGLFDGVPQAYGAIKTINSLVMSLAAVPAYLIARRVLPVGLSLGAALLAVAVPSLVYTATVMTENLFYPLFLLCAWALLLLLERPTWWRSVLFLALTAAAFMTRVQSVAIAGAAVTAPLLLVAFERRGLRGLRPYLPLYVLSAAAVLAAAVLQALRGESLRELLGAYAIVGDKSYDVGTVLRFWLWHLEELTLYLGVVPAAALIVLVGLARSLPRTTQAFLAATVSLLAWLSLVVAAFASQFANRIQERNLFAVGTLLLIALLVWVHRGAPRPMRLAVPAAVIAVALPLAFPYGRFIETGAISDTLALLPIWTLYGDLLFGSHQWTVGVPAVAGALLFLLVPRRYALVLPALVLVYFAVIAKPIWSGPHGFKQAGAGALFQGNPSQPRDWIDRAVPEGSSAAAVWTGRSDRFTINVNEFFNRRLGPVYFVGGPTPGGLPETEVTIAPATGLVKTLDGRTLPGGYYLLEGTLDPGPGRVLARDERIGATLWQLPGPLEQTLDIRGIYPDKWSAPTATYTKRRCRDGAVAVALSGDATLFPRAQRVTARSGGRTVTALVPPPPGRAVLRVEVTPDATGICRVAYTVTPTAVPAEVIPGNTDERELGTHFEAFVFEPAR
ncbi:MAG TPA: glycosyltransferase family 39 protein [Gaiellaceae bacterium]|nr:glycosyltransferase family 39 protein [Gaiellaceae bacterium]